MGKLGKKARKFAKKNLQSVLRQRRKNKAILFKRKSSSKGDQNNAENQDGDFEIHSNGRITDVEDVKDISLDAVFRKNDDFDMFEDVSDSDGYLFEDSSCPHVAESATGNILEGDGGVSSLSVVNQKIHEDLFVCKKKLERLKKKEPEFEKFLQNHWGDRNFQNEDMYSDEDEMGNQMMEVLHENETSVEKGRLFTSSAINSWIQLIREEQNDAALICLLNAYRAACHCGSESSSHQIQNCETFCNILIFVLSEADNMFRRILQISSSSCKKEIILELKNSLKWKNLRPLVKSYFRSTLFLLNQVADLDILAFALDRLRASLIFFTVFPSLLQRFIKTTVDLWSTGGGVLSSASFLFIRDVASLFSSDYLDTCISRTFMAYLAQSRVSEIANVKHMQFMMNSIVDICSLDVQKSSIKALECISQLSRILLWGLKTKKKEALNTICSWEYANCIDLWVTFISTNQCDHDLQHLLFRTIQLINGVSQMFSGPRYFPLRLKCIQWLNNLSISSGIFVPVTSYVLDVLEYKIVKEGGKRGNALNFTSVLKLPKSCLKSQTFQQECLLAVIEQLSAHFAQWSYHISFPELATIPLIHLKKFHDTTTSESMRRMMKRLIDQVERNVDFVQKKRDEVAFSPNDHQSIESFLQLEKSRNNAPFTQYYRSILEKAALRSLHKNDNISLLEQKNERKRGQPRENLLVARLSADPALTYSAIGIMEE